MTPGSVASLPPPPRRRLRNVESQSRNEDTVKSEGTAAPLEEGFEPPPSVSSAPPPRKSRPAGKAALLQARKLRSFAAHCRSSPFPSFPRPTRRECSLAHGILASIHGERRRPDAVAAPSAAAGCGDSPSVLDALVRTILSQNTSDKNSARAKLSMDKAYGGSDNWEAIVQGGTERLRQTIRCGGLGVVKSKAIMSTLRRTRARYGTYSLDHLLGASNDSAMRELLSFQGVGPKTASCVLLFCLRRDSFAVDTHVHRISGLLGWRPAGATREETQAHLEARVPDEDKYGLHVLMVTHGKTCGECKAGGRETGRCALRRAFLRRDGADDARAEDEAKPAAADEDDEEKAQGYH
ncbi:base excision dna repair [Trichoderma cornu-damae]|uniref:Base excision dna repair n=1 Tax=Trichoderma cornu-damae TaxID=654480 RepID=A0A9P8TSL5_9HYPO|nr:base excision dna repair [Trichoderma cornu-damae]